MKRLDYEPLLMEVVVFETEDVMNDSGEEIQGTKEVTLPLIPLP